MSYNGWTNHQTWIINVHFGDDFAGDFTGDAGELEATIKEIVGDKPVCNDVMSDLICDPFEGVNWHELVEAWRA